jgi:cytoplasmic iron level regulating protein YaaA (DUF328/UPF0246 family)
MLIVLSPAKSLDFSQVNRNTERYEPIFVKEAATLIKGLRKLKASELSSLMNISAKLADLNFERFLKWDPDHSNDETKQAVLAFKGDVYIGLDAGSLSDDHLRYVNKNVRILSGLYGILRPFDSIHEYRLEMGTKLENSKGKDLYSFWGTKIASEVNKAIEQSDGEKVLINLASNEYFKSIDQKTLKYPIITPVFKDFKDDKYKVISFFAKKARGMMTRYVAENNITEPEKIKTFNYGNYSFNEELTKGNEWVFTR